MTNEHQETDHSSKKNPPPFGLRLKTAREELGLQTKDAAAQLRLSEKIIIMMEKNRYAADLPITFVRGYLKAYGKLLNIPDHDIQHAISHIQPKVELQAKPVHDLPDVTTGNIFMQFFTYLIILTLVGLVGTWWYTHASNPTSNPMPQAFVKENPKAIPLTSLPEIKQEVISNNVVPVNNQTASVKAPAEKTLTLQPADEITIKTISNETKKLAASNQHQTINSQKKHEQEEEFEEEEQ